STPPQASGPSVPGQTPTVTTEPSRATRRAVIVAAPSRATASSPQTTAAVLAALAATQVGAATETRRQQSLATSPVNGSTMWCSVRSPRRQDRETVLEVASPPLDRQ